MALCFLLRRRKVEFVLRFGVRKDQAGTLLAHAWVELDERKVADAGDGRSSYAVLG